MPFAGPISRVDDHGRWLLFQHNNQPALQAFFPRRWQLQQPFSIFWLGTSERSHITDFLGAIIQPRSEIRMRLINQLGVANFFFPREVEGGSTWTLADVLNKLEMSAQPTMFSASVNRSENEPTDPNAFALYVWATIVSGDEPEPRIHGDEDGPDVGVRVALSEWTKERWQETLINMFASTSRVSVPRHDVMQLPNLIISTAHYMLQNEEPKS